MRKKVKNKITKYRMRMRSERTNSHMWNYCKFAIEVEHDLIRERVGKKEKMNYKRIR